MPQALPERASAVVIGGGVSGARVATCAIHRFTSGWCNRMPASERPPAGSVPTAAWAALGAMGLQSRALLERVTCADLSNEAFPFGTAQQMES